MTSGVTPAQPFVPAPGRQAWLLRGPDRELPSGDLWQAIASSLGADPSRPRVRSREHCLTGADLLDGVGRFALLPPGRWIGVHVARSVAMVQAVLAVWSRGSTYIPLPTELPATRLATMVEGCRPDAIVTDADMSLETYDRVAARVVAGRRLAILRRAARAAAPIDPAGRPCCYVAHTSGSTGAPKAVRVSHRALINRLTAMRRLASPTDGDRVLFKTSLAFDVHVWEFAFPLVAGCLLVVHDQEPFFDLRSVARLIVDEGVTVAGFVPSLLGALLDRPDFASRARMRVMFCGGETWPAGLARRFHQQQPGCELRNSYGPAETTLAVANWLVPRDPVPTRIEIGAPIENAIFMVDEISREGDVVIGTLGIGGAPVADGYVATPVPDPFVEHVIDGRPVRFYRTGDLMELHVGTGAMLFRGRSDQQIKLNGVRIELGEVEAAIQSLDEVEACAVVLLDRTSAPCLLATYKTSADRFLDPSRVRKRCAELLPSTHVPAYFRAVDRYALNSNGKIDRRRIEDALTP